MDDEKALIAALRRRDPEAFAQLFNLYSDKVYRLAVGLLENEDEAEGVVQDAFLRLFERLEQFEGRSKLSTWLYRVTYNLCQDRLRKRRPLLPLADDAGEQDDGLDLPMPTVYIDWEQLPEKYFSAAEITAELDKAIATLPPKLKSVFILREMEGLSTQECAEVLGISPGSVKVRLHRARLHLREQLATYFAELSV